MDTLSAVEKLRETNRLLEEIRTNLILVRDNVENDRIEKAYQSIMDARNELDIAEKVIANQNL